VARPGPVVGLAVWWHHGKEKTMIYRMVDTSTLEGLREAERLHAAGWTIYASGLFLLYFYKRGQLRKGAVVASQRALWRA
jgi:hypothetical protein